jgi:hypothetical protein
VNTKKDVNVVNFISPFLFNNTYGLPVLTMGTKIQNQVFYLRLVDLQTICAKYGVNTSFSPNDDICLCLFDIQCSRTKNAF